MEKDTLLARLAAQPDDVQNLNAIACHCLEGGEIGEAINYLNRALSLQPHNIESVARRSAAWLRVGNMDAALSDLYDWLRLDPKNSEARDQIRFIHKKLVGSWHFDMMNDAPRNLAYQSAINTIVKPGMTVFEIGTGSGLLSMMAARAGAAHVFTCEKVLPIRKAATEIIRRNGFQERVTVLDKWSTSVQLGKDIPERVDVVVAEVFGPALLEEQALHFFKDARERLLKPGGVIIPARATMYGQLIESPEIASRGIVSKVCGFDLGLFSALHDDPAVQLSLAKHSHRALSEPFVIRALEMGGDDGAQGEDRIEIDINANGTCDCVAQWFKLEIGTGHFVDTGPSSPPTHWEQHVQIFERPTQVEQGKRRTVLVRQCSDRFSLRIAP